MMMTARKLLGICIILTILCGFAYWLGPMNTFDAICHAMTTMSSGGFSTHQSSIGFWNSPYLEYISSFFMILSGINFSLYYFLFTGEVKMFRQNEELKWYIGLKLTNSEHNHTRHASGLWLLFCITEAVSK